MAIAKQHSNSKEFVGLIKFKQFLENISTADLAKALDMSEATFYNRLNRPLTFSVGEIKQLVRLLKLSAEDILNLFKMKG